LCLCLWRKWLRREQGDKRSKGAASAIACGQAHAELLAALAACEDRTAVGNEQAASVGPPLGLSAGRAAPAGAKAAAASKAQAAASKGETLPPDGYFGLSHPVRSHTPNTARRPSCQPAATQAARSLGLRLAVKPPRGQRLARVCFHSCGQMPYRLSFQVLHGLIEGLPNAEALVIASEREASIAEVHPCCIATESPTYTLGRHQRAPLWPHRSNRNAQV